MQVPYFLEYKPALNKCRSWLDAGVNRAANAINARVWQNGTIPVPHTYPHTSNHPNAIIRWSRGNSQQFLWHISCSFIGEYIMSSLSKFVLLNLVEFVVIFDLRRAIYIKHVTDTALTRLRPLHTGICLCVNYTNNNYTGTPLPVHSLSQFASIAYFRFWLFH